MKKSELIDIINKTVEELVGEGYVGYGMLKKKLSNKQNAKNIDEIALNIGKKKFKKNVFKEAAALDRKRKNLQVKKSRQEITLNEVMSTDNIKSNLQRWLKARGVVGHAARNVIKDTLQNKAMIKRLQLLGSEDMANTFEKYLGDHPSVLRFRKESSFKDNFDGSTYDAPYKSAQVIRGKKMIPPEDMTSDELKKYEKGIRASIKRAEGEPGQKVFVQNMRHMLKRVAKSKKSVRKEGAALDRTTDKHAAERERMTEKHKREKERARESDQRSSMNRKRV